MKKLVIFDCDGTLVDSEVIASKVYPQYWATHGVFFSEDEFKEKFIGTGHDAEIVKETFSRMPDFAKAEGERLLDQALAKELTAVDGIKEILLKLAVEKCVASNSSLSYVKQALNKTELSHHFGDKVFSAEQVENPKPAADLFLHACSTLGFETKNTFVVEDSPSGVRAAQNASIKVIGFSGAGHFTSSLEARLEATNPDYFCRSVLELENLLVELIKL